MSVNRVILIGNLGQPPEVRQTTTGATVCNLSIATSHKWKDKNTGEKIEETEWHRVVCFDRIAKFAAEYMEKGRCVYVEGRLKTRKWTDKEGIERYNTDIIADDLRPVGGSGGDSGGDQKAKPKRPDRGPSVPAYKPAQKKLHTDTGTGFDDIDDDIPF